MKECRRRNLHERAIRFFVRKLSGNKILRIRGKIIDMIVDGTPVAVRGSTIHIRQHKVISKSKQYTYDYPMIHFNFHVHTRMPDIPNLVWALVAFDQNGRAVEWFVIPNAAITGKTFAYNRYEKRRHPYEGRYAHFRKDLAPLASATA
ncbi:hypothetical protein ACFL3E_00380 [Patescibacteria group bacterium]